MAHIFISYAKKDTKPLATALFNALNAIDGLTAWMDKSLEADSSWAEQIKDEIDRSDYMIVLLSPDVNRKTLPRSFVLKEIHYAQQKHLNILPVMVSYTEQPFLINDIHYIDLTDTPDDPTPIIERVKRKFEIGGLVEEIEAPFSGIPMNLRQEVVGIAVLILIAIVGGAFLLNWGRETPNPTLEPTTAVAQIGSATPTVTNTPALTNFELLQTAQAAETAMIIAMTETVALGQILERTATSTLTSTPTPTFTATQMPTLNPTEIIATLAATNVLRNADWTPVEREFNGVMMVLVPTGCFEMGSDIGQEDEKPAHHQCIETSFWLDKTEVTQGQFRANGGEKVNPNRFSGNRHPVEYITWREAVAYCHKQGGRLPTEAEWEYSARGPDGLIYPWGDEFISENVVYGENSDGETAEVGSRLGGQAWVGALDMSGNVWEWVSTAYGIDDGDNNYSEDGEKYFSYPYISYDGRENTEIGFNYTYILRGGSWDYPVNLDLRSSNRLNSRFYGSTLSWGFRCARDYSE